MNPSLLILFFLADNRKYMLSRWDFSVRAVSYTHLTLPTTPSV